MISKTLQLSNNRIAHYLEQGEGEPLVLIHGVGMQAAAWYPQIEYFSKHYRVISVDMPGHERQVRAGKVTAPEEYKRRFLVPAPKSVEWKTAYIDGRLHRRIAMLVRAAGCGSISGFIIRLLELHMEEHREDIAALLGEVYRPWDEDGQPGEPARR